MRTARWIWMLGLLVALAGCERRDRMVLENKLPEVAKVDVMLPMNDLTGDCGTGARERFCAEEYRSVDLIEISPGHSRELVLHDNEARSDCANQVWLRLPFYGDMGPVADPGTLFELPATAEIERNPGALHGVAFPGITIRIDDASSGDISQSRPPPSCDELGRTPRG